MGAGFGVGAMLAAESRDARRGIEMRPRLVTEANRVARHNGEFGFVNIGFTPAAKRTRAIDELIN